MNFEYFTSFMPLLSSPFFVKTFYCTILLAFILFIVMKADPGVVEEMMHEGTIEELDACLEKLQGVLEMVERKRMKVVFFGRYVYNRNHEIFSINYFSKFSIIYPHRIALIKFQTITQSHLKWVVVDIKYMSQLLSINLCVETCCI